MLSVNTIVCEDVKNGETIDINGIFNCVEINETEGRDKGFCIVNIGCVDENENCYLYTSLEHVNDEGKYMKGKIVNSQKIKTINGEMISIMGILRFKSKKIFDTPGIYYFTNYKVEEELDTLKEVRAKGTKLSFSRIEVKK